MPDALDAMCCEHCPDDPDFHAENEPNTHTTSCSMCDRKEMLAQLARSEGWLAPEDVAAHDAELRESIAKEIEANCVWELEDGDGLCGICADAARIARGKE